MNAWKVILPTLVIFGAGVITGGLLVSYAVHANQTPVQKADVKQPPLNPWQVRVRELLRRMDHELDLTPEQRQHIETIIAASQERIKVLMRQEMQGLYGQIRSELTPDQKRKFNELLRSGPAHNRKPFQTNSPSAGITNPTATNALPANP